MSNPIVASNKHVGLWTLVYNVVLFSAACLLLFAVKRYPNYNIAIIITIVGIILVNIHCMIRYYWYSQNVKKMLAAEQANIVPRHCPDYWNKVTTADNTVVCKNQFVQPQLPSDPTSKPTTYTFGNKAPTEYSLPEIANMTNQQKCWNFTQAGIPWVDLQNKCSDAGV